MHARGNELGIGEEYRGEPGQWALRMHFYLAPGPIAHDGGGTTQYASWVGRDEATGRAFLSKLGIGEE